MKRYTLLIIIAALCFMGCENSKGDSNGNKPSFGFTVSVINDCQYVVYVDRANGSATMVHAGNCNNPIHNQ
jgi:hypothetical protein